MRNRHLLSSSSRSPPRLTKQLWRSSFRDQRAAVGRGGLSAKDADFYPQLWERYLDGMKAAFDGPSQSSV